MIVMPEVIVLEYYIISRNEDFWRRPRLSEWYYYSSAEDGEDEMEEDLKVVDTMHPPRRVCADTTYVLK